MDTAREIPVLRRVVMIGAPLLLGVCYCCTRAASADRLTNGSSNWSRSGNAGASSNVIQMPLFAALGLSVLWMLPRRGTASQVSQIALAAYIVLYPAFDALVGIGSGLLLSQRATLNAPADQAVLDRAIQALFFDPAGIALWMAILASACWSVGAVAGAMSLWRSAGWRVAAPLLVSGVALGIGHVSPQGPLASVMLATASWQFMTRARPHTHTVPAAVAA